VIENDRLMASATPSPAGAAMPAVSAPVADQRSTLMRHPAVVAWCRLHPDAAPLRITPVKVRRKKSAAYRLEGTGWAGGPVIAKRCLKSVALVEHTVYEGILPRAAVTSLRYYGFLEESDGEHCWLFALERLGWAPGAAPPPKTVGA